MSTPTNKPKPVKVLISPNATMEQLEAAVRQMLGHPTPEPQQPDPPSPSAKRSRGLYSQFITALASIMAAIELVASRAN